MSKMLQGLKKLVENKTKDMQPYLFLDKEPKYEDYFFGKTLSCLSLYASLVLLHVGKNKEPMVKVDTSLLKALNSHNYFPASIGAIFGTQTKLVINKIKENKSCPYVIADNYNLQRAKKSTQLWIIYITPISNNKIDVRAIFGPSNLLPMLPYEILGVATVVFKLANILKRKVENIHWFFSSIDCSAIALWGNVKYDYPKGIVPTKIFDIETAGALVKIERSLRSDPSMRPLVDIPPTKFTQFFTKELKDYYNGTIKP